MPERFSKKEKSCKRIDAYSFAVGGGRAAYPASQIPFRERREPFRPQRPVIFYSRLYSTMRFYCCQLTVHVKLLTCFFKLLEIARDTLQKGVLTTYNFVICTRGAT